MDHRAAAIEATGVTAVKEAPKTQTKRKKCEKNTNVDGADGSQVSAGAAKATYLGLFKKKVVQEEATALKSIFRDNFVQLPDDDLPWQTGCPSFRIAQVLRSGNLMWIKLVLMTACVTFCEPRHVSLLSGCSAGGTRRKSFFCVR